MTINHHRDQAAAEATQRQIIQADGKTRIVQVDVSSVADMRKLIERKVQAFGRLDVMVNDAGMETRTSEIDTTEHRLNLVLGVDLKSAFFGRQLAAKQMVK